MRGAILAVLLVAVSACKDDGVNSISRSPEDIFETEFVSWSWAYAYHGVVIDQDGAVYSYNPGRDTVPLLYHQDGYYDASELASKYAHDRAFIRIIPADTLRLMRELATSTTTEKFSDTVWVGWIRSRGLTTCAVYRWCPPVAMYQKIILSVAGTYAFHNESAGAIALTNLLGQGG